MTPAAALNIRFAHVSLRRNAAHCPALAIMAAGTRRAASRGRLLLHPFLGEKKKDVAAGLPPALSRYRNIRLDKDALLPRNQKILR